MSAAHQLTAIDFEINQEWLGTVLLAGLPNHYQPIIMALKSSDIQITGDSIKTKFLQESSCDKSKSTIDGGSAFHVKRQFKSARSEFKPKNFICWACGKSGHLANECIEKKGEGKKVF